MYENRGGRVREIIDIDWSIIFERIEEAIRKHNKTDSPDFVERMEYLKGLRDRLKHGERSEDLYTRIIDIEL